MGRDSRGRQECLPHGGERFKSAAEGPHLRRLRSNRGRSDAGHSHLSPQCRLSQRPVHLARYGSQGPPRRPRHYNLGLALAGCGRADQAITHFQKALEIKPDLVEAHDNLGLALAGRGQVDEAIACYRKALQIKPNLAEAHDNLGLALAGRGQVDDAIACYRKALQIKPNLAEAHDNLGLALAGRGQVDDAIVCYRKALQIKPDLAEAHNNFGVLLGQRGRFDEAIVHLQQALKIKPDFAEAHNNLGNALNGQGKLAEAVVQWREAVRLQPNQIAYVNNLAWLLATCPEASVRNGAEAVELARRAVQLSGSREPALLGTLAAAYAEAGRFPAAVQTARKALELAAQQNTQALVESLQAKLPLYEAGTPFREPQQPSPARPATR